MAELRARILSEIRRIAEANGGRAPGVNIFQRETAIRRAEWLGVYWARWGDALVEAGYGPNRLQGKLDAAELFEAFVEATRHIGRVPTEAEFRMFRRSRPAIPSHSTYQLRFGSRAVFFDQFREWLEERPSYKDVLSMLPVAAMPTRDAAERSRPEEGHVYLIRSGSHYKIGHSEELERRVKEIRVALPEAAVLVHAILTDDPPGIEAYWHKRFSNRRANGEWFKLTLADVSAFKRRKFQ